MSAFVGALLDVSGSMKRNMGDGTGAEGGPWVHSMFTALDDIVKHDVSSENRVFSIAFGARGGDQMTDIIKTIELTNGDSVERASISTIDNIYIILERNGAKSIRKWAVLSDVQRALTENVARNVLRRLNLDSAFARAVVYDCLPSSCRDWKAPIVGGVITYIFSSAVTTLHQADIDEIRGAVAKVMKLMCRIDNASVVPVHQVQTALHGCIGKRKVTEARCQELLKNVEPYIYRATPLCSAIREASNLILRNRHNFREHNKLLLIMSDGEPTDDAYGLKTVQTNLASVEVKIVSCYISTSSNVQPRRLYDVAQYGWNRGAQFMFDLSSTVPTQLLIRAILIKRGWEINIENNNTRLFVHANHPDHLKDACELARSVICFQDALSDFLVSVSVDVYINGNNQGARAPTQVGETCYANAAATVLHLAMHRIVGRGQYPSFQDLRDELVRDHGIEGADTLRVLQKVCPKYSLRCREVDTAGAMKAISEKRPVVARFSLTEDEWDTFYSFFRRNPRGAIKESDFNNGRRNRYGRARGHAVVLTSYNSKCLRLMNSLGESWGDMGFFRVENVTVLNLKFIDVYWDENDLTQTERTRYKAHGSEVAGKLMKSLKGLQVATFTCPLCHQKSRVTEFSGILSRVSCPKCFGEFNSSANEGNILALNVYLTSLSA